jgi:hypothetical protein
MSFILIRVYIKTLAGFKSIFTKEKNEVRSLINSTYRMNRLLSKTKSSPRAVGREKKIKLEKKTKKLFQKNV